MIEFWDKRYGGERYAYGELPNMFFKQEILKLKPGKLLLPAEGEGRNAVFAATLGWQVSAFDISTAGQKKAFALADKFGVKIDYRIATFEQFEKFAKAYDCVALIFAHSIPRKLNHRLAQEWLKPGGKIILQGFEKAQLLKNSGGPSNIDLLFSREELEADFAKLNLLNIEIGETELNEGEFHMGMADVINLTGLKK